MASPSTKHCMRCNCEWNEETDGSVATATAGLVRMLLLCEDCLEALEEFFARPAVRYFSVNDSLHVPPSQNRFVEAARKLHVRPVAPAIEPSFHGMGSTRKPGDPTDPLSACEHRIHRSRCSLCWPKTESES